MKKFKLYNFKKNKIAAFLIILFLAGNTSFSQAQVSSGLKSVKDVIAWYKGWEGNPDTIKVFIDSTFTNAEKDSIQEAMNRWNAANGKPKLVQGTSAQAKITFTKNGKLDANTAGETSLTHDKTTGKVSKAKIEINPNHPGLSLKEVVTHELGHALGLDDTAEDANPGDVMKGSGPTNGNDGKLSKHDSAEIAAAAKVQVTVKKRALVPPGPIVPGTTSTLEFELDTIYPPSVASQALINIMPVRDPFLEIINSQVSNNLLMVNVVMDPMHWSGDFYMDINIIFPLPYEPVSFLGEFFAHINPVPPTTFTCPFEVTMENGTTYVSWESMCTYPYTGALRSNLMVDDNVMYLNRGGGRYVLELAPGDHTLMLNVDDFMGNSASSVQIVTITGTGDDRDDGNKHSQVLVYPNPFRNTCSIKCDAKASIDILNLNGSVVEHLPAGSSHWSPGKDVPSGIYIFRINSGDNIMYKRIVYMK